MALGKFGGRIAYSIADDVTVFLTNWAAIQDLTGIGATINLNGTYATQEERLNKGMGGFTNVFGFVFTAEKSLLEGAYSYSKYAYKKNWTKEVTREGKQFLRNQVNVNAEQNLKALNTFDWVTNSFTITEKSINTVRLNDNQ